MLFRQIEGTHPTLLLDEIDAVFGKGRDDRNEPLRALLNAGFERGAKVAFLASHTRAREGGL